MDTINRKLRAWRGIPQRARGLGVAMLLLAPPAAAQWSTQSPVPTFLDVGGVGAPSAGRVFLATDDDPFDQGGALFESTDGGTTWVQREVPFSLGGGLNGIFFLDDQLGWTWGNVNYRTTDGGTTWTELPFLGSAYSMEFYTASFGLAAGNFGASVSSDGGLSWDASPDQMSAFDFADDLTGLGASGTGLHRTVDGGDPGAAVRFVVVQAGPGGTFGDFTEVTPLDPLFVTPQDEDFWVATTAPADYDGDGDLDVAVLGFYVVYNTSVEERLVLLRNDGPAGQQEWEFAYLDVPLGTLTAGASDLAWGDVDGDGDQDLAVATDGQTVVYRNDAGTLAATDSALPAYWEDNDQADFDLRSITWADFDNDGDLDLLLPSVWDDATFTLRTALMRNDGPNGSGGWSFSEVAAGLAPTAHAQSAWADADGDQDLDLLLVNLAPLTGDGFIRRYHNVGGGVFVGEDLLGGLTVEHGEAQWGDYDADGDLDILVAGNVREPDGTYDTVLRVYRNDAETYVPVEVIPCPLCEGWWDLTAATWADYDSDGDVDILLAGNYNSGSQIEGRAKVYDNEGGVFTDSGNQLPAPRATGSRGGSFTWLDLDGEGDLDYFVAGQYFVPGGNGLVEAQMHVYRNDAPGQNDAPSAPSSLAAEVDGTGGTVLLWWEPADDDLTPAHALTYDLRLFSQGGPASTPRRLPEPGGLSAAGQWTLAGLPEGLYTWTLRAVDSAYNGGPDAESTFTVGNPDPTAVFADGFESGDLTGWSTAAP